MNPGSTQNQTEWMEVYPGTHRPVRSEGRRPGWNCWEHITVGCGECLIFNTTKKETYKEMTNGRCRRGTQDEVFVVLRPTRDYLSSSRRWWATISRHRLAHTCITTEQSFIVLHMKRVANILHWTELSRGSVYIGLISTVGEQGECKCWENRSGQSRERLE